MAGMEIVLYPHPALRWKSKPLPEVTADARQVARQMFDLMYEAKGVGLACNQVALPWRMFVLNLTGKPEEKSEEHVFINPEIVRRRGTQEEEEGCLSFPKLYGQVRRAKEIVVSAPPPPHFNFRRARIKSSIGTRILESPFHTSFERTKRRRPQSAST